jgi:DNA-binding winged helix-turn-helix (wHTH) protein
MLPIPQWSFASFRLDTAKACLWRGTDLIALKPKTFAVLRYLVEHAGRLVTKEELLDTLWSGTAVGEAALTVRIAELRARRLERRPGRPSSSPRSCSVAIASLPP